MKITNISDAGLFVNAKFAVVNKHDLIEHYRIELAEKRFRLNRCKVTEVVQMTCEEYDAFTHSLLTDRDWLSGKGGDCSEADLREVESFWEYTVEEQEQWISQGYRLVLAVSAPRRATIYVDPQGHDYARYVGM